MTRPMASVHSPSGVPYDRRWLMPPAAVVCLRQPGVLPAHRPPCCGRSHRGEGHRVFRARVVTLSPAGPAAVSLAPSPAYQTR
jgi:hypothetical protein